MRVMKKGRIVTTRVARFDGWVLFDCFFLLKKSMFDWCVVR